MSNDPSYAEQMDAQEREEKEREGREPTYADEMDALERE